MKIAMLIKSGPSTAEAARALQTAGDLLSQGHAVSLWLLQDAVNLGRPVPGSPAAAVLADLIAKNLHVHILGCDAALRGLAAFPAAGAPIAAGDYDALIELLESSDRVIGLL